MSKEDNERAHQIVARWIKILDEENVDFKRYILDHNTEETIGITLEIPEILAGITLYPT